MTRLRRAADEAQMFLLHCRTRDGGYRLGPWPEVRRRRTSRGPGPEVARLRITQRRSIGFLDPLEDALYLAAGLRSLGHDASFHLGLDLVPAAGHGGYYPWVECAGKVVSTSLPVREEYIEVHRSPARLRPC